jgi:hypothetical protein
MVNKLKKKISNFINYPLSFSSFDSRFQSKLRKINMATHQWLSTDDGYVCGICDCGYGSRSSEWPCGYPVPRGVDIL